MGHLLQGNNVDTETNNLQHIYIYIYTYIYIIKNIYTYNTSITQLNTLDFLFATSGPVAKA